jgi:hypothetical protein
VRQILIAFILSLSLAACGGSRNIVIDPVESSSARFAGDWLYEDNSTVAIEDDEKAYFQKKLTEYLEPRLRLGDRDGLQMKYRLIGYDDGNRGKRWLAGFTGWGEGSLVIQTVFMTPDGEELSTVNTDASISGGFFGGDIESTFKNGSRQDRGIRQRQFSQPLARAPSPRPAAAPRWSGGSPGQACEIGASSTLTPSPRTVTMPACRQCWRCKRQDAASPN